VRSLARYGIREPLAAKVPEITAIFWLCKLLTTAGGEATSDYLAGHNVVVGGAVEAIILILAAVLQFRTRRYFAPSYWFLALAIAISGTGVADTMHLHFDIPYAGTTVFWAAVLAIIFWAWNRSEGTLSIHSITSIRREAFYWATVFATFALGTAAGDLTATPLHLGYLTSAVLFASIILVPAIGWRFFGLNEVVAFWFAYVLTRPIGASLADYASKAKSASGLDFGDAPTAAATVVAVAIVVAYLSLTKSDIQEPGVVS
jgi:uncharacterized membrane-anchored protein